ncbi:alanine/ornithine racemase family PLP-dependent enzyme [Brevibacillus sp. SYP-B805]|uniref:alanine/ornithine racemase family PLP-dependent enzyme n=1 Tax=Brevibacillus sp. SYP-B805 TaxID=1578199 RepID=UPI0013EDD4C0|nr:alanine/ornithine racemase family PLP-dependent enzyme [Brevibacillus sp. SYP-B805]NGQ96907.1 alanine/ornithine racemase family PLP-dependent enzyme [Brevibacillus sp. SYP-B805]
MKFPAMYIDLAKIRHNAQLLNRYCGLRGVRIAVVTKGISAQERIVRTLYDAGIREYADSRLSQLRRMRHWFGKECRLMLLRIPSPSEVHEVLQYCDVSLNSDIETIARLDQAARAYGIFHEILLMVEMGDLREGILPHKLDAVLKQLTSFPRIRLAGIGANFTCYGGVIPTAETMGELSRLAQHTERIVGYPLTCVSGGNSSSLPLIMQRCELGRVNHLRIGEAVFLGRETAYGQRISGLYQDAFEFAAEIVELHEKPSVPQGPISRNAFGQIPRFEDRGIRLKAILSAGRLDVCAEDLKPSDAEYAILGSSSDHLIVDVTDGPPVKVGESIRFQLTYGALARLMNGRGIHKYFRCDPLLELLSAVEA